MELDRERIKELTLDKISGLETKRSFSARKVLLVAALLATGALLLLGATKLFDWKVMVNGEIQQGDYGDTIIVGESFAAMTPVDPSEGNTQIVQTVFPDKTPDRTAKPGELSLFACQSERGDMISILSDIEIGREESTNLAHFRQLAENAQAKLHWPTLINSDYKVLSSTVRFYTQKEQIDRCELVYNSFGTWKNQQVFLLPEGYETCVNLMNLELETPEGKRFHFTGFLAETDSQIYGSSGSSIIEPLEVQGYQSVVFVSDQGWNQLYAWKKIPAVASVDPLAFGEKERPQTSLLSKMPQHDSVYQWRQYSFDSETLSKQELLQLLVSIDLTK